MILTELLYAGSTRIWTDGDYQLSENTDGKIHVVANCPTGCHYEEAVIGAWILDQWTSGTGGMLRLALALALAQTHASKDTHAI